MRRTGTNGFGQRPPGVTRESLRTIQGVDFEMGDEPEQGASRLRRLLFWAGAGVLIVGIYFGTRGSGQGLKQYWSQHTPPPIAEAYVAVGIKDVHLDQANNTCRSRGDAAAKVLRSKDAAADAVTMRQSTVYVACLAAESPKRLCQVGHRTHLLAAVTTYYRLQSKKRDAGIASDPQVAEALRSIVSHGYVPRRDLISAAGQSDLDIVLHGVEARRAGCGG